LRPSVTSALAGHHDRAAPQRPDGHFRWLATYGSGKGGNGRM
jgi:hypothetical protein